ncbi:Enolase-phosphatase E1 [Entomortierella chlamydospora]|uniref:Enolase-phosphatase E1 n=1 Tax=Entomortierella chlamydospora TaxID=101097 RepID=A0A9P6MU92_9FUNG|nr:Enolase-phosphatase E1 [Entomortierella chlamydospora]KAG0012558.1 Enolase-phosphatase E1 [Entomortierella chlamydospora]
MVLTRSRSNNQGNAAPSTTASAPKAAPAKRKSNASATKAPKAAKTESTTDVSTAKDADAPVASDPAPIATVETEKSETIATESAEPAAAPAEEAAAATGSTNTVEAIQAYDAVVSDIEGTTTPIVFVKEILFPFVTSKLSEFLKKNWSSKEMKKAVEELRVQAAKDVADGLPDATLIATESADISTEKVHEDVIASITWQMKADRKIAALKTFQGYMWKEGYTNGDLKGEIYEDVIPALDQWKNEGKKLYIYSSGSIEAQKLLFGFSEKGDLLHYFSGHYDTTIGQKIESESYTKIASDIGLSPNRILFLSDNIHEIVAAKKAGFQAVVTDRPGNATLSEEDRKDNIVVKSFLDIPKPQ